MAVLGVSSRAASSFEKWKKLISQWRLPLNKLPEARIHIRPDLCHIRGDRPHFLPQFRVFLFERFEACFDSSAARSAPGVCAHIAGHVRSRRRPRLVRGVLRAPSFDIRHQVVRLDHFRQ